MSLWSEVSTAVRAVTEPDPARRADSHRADRGFTLVELLVVIVILGTLATVVVFSVSGLSADAGSSTCRAERHQLETASEAYFAQFRTTTIPDAGGPEGYEQTLVDGRLIRQTSELYDLDPDGQLVQVVGSICTV